MTRFEASSSAAHADGDADERGQQVHPGGQQRAERQDEHQDGDGDADELGRADLHAGGAEGVAADGHLQPGVLRRSRGLLQRVEGAVVEALAGHVEARPSRARPAGPG